MTIYCLGFKSPASTINDYMVITLKKNNDWLKCWKVNL